MHSDLQNELKRTDFTLRRLGLLIAEQHRKTFPAEFISALLSEPDPRSLEPPQVKQLLPILEQLPSAAPKPNTGQPSRQMANRIIITGTMREALQSEMDRTKVGLTAMCRYLFPEDERQTVYHTIYGVLAGKRKTADKDVWNTVLAYLETLETSEGPKARQLHKRIKLSATESQAAFPDADSTQILPDLVRESIKPPPKRPRLKSYVLQDRYSRNGYVVIHEELYAALHEERMRSCVSFIRLLKDSDDVPAGLNSYQVKQWFLGTVLAAEKRYLDWVLNAYRALPDYPPSNR